MKNTTHIMNWFFNLWEKKELIVMKIFLCFLLIGLMLGCGWTEYINPLEVFTESAWRSPSEMNYDYYYFLINEYESNEYKHFEFLDFPDFQRS